MPTRPEPVVTTTAGKVRGRWRDTPGGPSAAFLGIPYAEAPVGDLRFAAPRRRASWTGVRDAVAYGPTAQVEPLAAVTTIPEPSTPGDDLLNLNVFTPAPGEHSARLPVLVWIHGGGYMAGCQNSSWYDGDTFTADGVVVVSIGYRLGAEAWLHLDGAPDNRGALDWVAALTWVAENVDGFGGDPARVTIAGQSAGGGAVLDLLAMPSAAGLFARAMPISAALGEEDPATAHALTSRFTAVSGLPGTAVAARALSPRQMHDVTRALSTTPDGGLQIVCSPYADGVVIPRPVLDALAAGAGGHVPVMLGTTSHEFNLVGRDVPADIGDEALLAALTGAGVTPDTAAALVRDRQAAPGEILGQAVTDTTFRRLAVQAARARSGQAPTWLYEFAWGSRAASTAGLAFHCLDLPFWWDRLGGERVTDATGPRPPQDLASAMHAAMVRFVHGVDPGWAAFDGRTAMRWDEPARPDVNAYAQVIGLAPTTV